MIRSKNSVILLFIGALSLLVLLGLSMAYHRMHFSDEGKGSYTSLAPDTGTEEPLQYMNEDFTVKEGFHTNLPIVVLKLGGEIPDYKTFREEDSAEVVYDVEPYTEGSIRVINGDGADNSFKSPVVYESPVRIKKRGHTSYNYDKPQYLIKTVDGQGQEYSGDILGMGAGDSWILNGSMADKSMIRNYLPYRIASEIDGNAMSPDCRFCEVLIEKDGGYEYQGVYLFTESIDRGPSRVNLDKYKEKNVYTSYLVRRDRFTHFDLMLDTYGRLNGLSEQWIGLKYPGASKITSQTKDYIEKDFSRTEQILYADKESIFKAYDKYIQVDSFVDYFLINEYFGNYDAGEHSTYMYKNNGELLRIGPVWDFDQAMNNYFRSEMKPENIAFQTKPFYKQLTNDRRFITALKKRCSTLQRDKLSEEHVFSVIDETVAYLRSARVREWYRWAADYEDASFDNPHNYWLQDYTKNGVVISRFNDKYQQEIYTIKNYLHKHGSIIQEELTKLYATAEFNTSLSGENELLLFIIMILFLVPSFFISKKG